MSLGLIVSKTRGIMWRAISVSSRVWEGCKLIIWLVNLPRWVVIIIYIVYIPVMMMFEAMRMMEGFDQENIDITINNSPKRLISGGKARLARLANNHHVAISGKIICRPRAMIIVRL